jgi:membrane-bound lytic murein transglycosylase B
MLKRYGSILGRIEDRYGVPEEVLVAIWGLESDYGVNQGKYSTLRSLATLAYDCRRSEKFRAELLDALRIAERGDLTSSQMVGAWAKSARRSFSPLLISSLQLISKAMDVAT